MTPNIAEMFLWGCGGSLAVECLTVYTECLQTDFNYPTRFRKVFFWIIRLAISLIAGGLVIAYKVDQPLLAANIGASAPLILQTLASGINAKGL